MSIRVAERFASLVRRLRHAVLLLATLSWLACARPASAMDYSLPVGDPFNLSDNATNVWLLMSGEIRPGDYQKLLEFLRIHVIDITGKAVVISSQGGDVAEAIRIGKFIKSTYVPVVVGPRYGRCASACFIIFASAAQRVSMGGFIGIHRPSLKPENVRRLPLMEAQREESQQSHNLAQYLHSLEVPEQLIEEMLANAPKSMHWLSNDELAQLGQRAAWYEQLLVARCGLDTRKEAAALKSHDRYLDVWMQNVRVCASRITMPDAEAHLRAALSSKS
jgi:hypothetical protein